MSQTSSAGPPRPSRRGLGGLLPVEADDLVGNRVDRTDGRKIGIRAREESAGALDLRPTHGARRPRRARRARRRLPARVRHLVVADDEHLSGDA